MVCSYVVPMLFCFVQTKSFQSCDRCSSVAWARGRCSWKLGTFERSCKMKTQAMAAILQIILRLFFSISAVSAAFQRTFWEGKDCMSMEYAHLLAPALRELLREFAESSLFSKFFPNFFGGFNMLQQGRAKIAPVGQEPVELQCRLHQFEGLRLSPDHCRRGDLPSECRVKCM